MERTVPTTESEEIELYQRTYYSLLRTTDEVQVRSLVESHNRMASALHVKAGSPEIDLDALIYASLRLPDCITQVRLVVMSPSQRAFRQRGYPDVDEWETHAAQGRRRHMRYDGQETLAAFIASQSDIDDLVPMLTAYQIEWNKVYQNIHGTQVAARLEAVAAGNDDLEDTLRSELCRYLELGRDDLGRLEAAWQQRFLPTLVAMASQRKRFAVRLLSGSYADYRQATRYWWENILENIPTSLAERTVYFISSNTHSLVNILSGCALRMEGELIDFVEQGSNPGLLAEHNAIQEEQVPSSRENFLYYTLKKYTAAPEGAETAQACLSEMRSAGIFQVDSLHNPDVGSQVIELSALQPDWLDPRVRVDGLELLRDSDAIILNIDYPLGLAAYRILTQITTEIGSLLGLYILGKAATLNGRVGDVMIPGVVHDEHSQNTYIFENAFVAADVRPHLIYGTVLDNQKAISVRGTFLQNRQYMDVFYREGFTDIEMEAGPYLSAVYEAIRPRRYPVDEIVDLHWAPFEIGILHYASDTPFTRGTTLAEQLSYFGMDPTYACSIAILRRVLEREIAAIRARHHAAPKHRAVR
jgi:hypothetical protein